MNSPTQRSKKYLKDNGYEVHVSERWNPFAKVRQDAFGFIDLIAIGNGRILGIQTTSRSNVAARRTKILGIPAAKSWLLCGAHIVVHGWGMVGKKGKRKKYELREVPVTLEDFNANDRETPAGTEA